MAEVRISDDMVEAYDDGEALGMVRNRKLSGWALRAAAIREGLAAVVPLIRARVLREEAPGLVDRAADAARRMAGDDATSAAIMASIVESALWQALGCTCSDHSDEGAVYIEDLTCPMHGAIQVLPVGDEPRDMKGGDE